MVEAAIILIGVVCLLAVVTLRRDLAGAPGNDPASLLTTGRALVAVRDWTFLLGPGLMPGVNALLLGWLLYRSGLVPRLIPALGLIGAPLLIASATAALFRGNHPIPVLAAIATAPIFLWELSLGIWLVVKGFKPSPSPPAWPNRTLRLRGARAGQTTNAPDPGQGNTPRRRCHPREGAWQTIQT
jgi:uncharacterized protein DUF4386